MSNVQVKTTGAINEQMDDRTNNNESIVEARAGP